ncbi:hypothetical protein PHMEG_00037685 [Phytophthora megakarya]|uniref:Uncharacterized protein n=1 Tax=Phytophthora megakarya TaxID=4795 RepID=A0A225UIL0_9STRA|nr:hypothetical protein PHMEG_00037685 [Phytophthora megakarya]
MLLLDVPELGVLVILDPAVIPTVTTQATAVVVEVADLLQIRLDCLSFLPCFPDASSTLTTHASLAVSRLGSITLRTWIRGSAFPRTGQYCSHLITGLNVRDLMAALPWNVLTGANIPEPMSIEITVNGRLGFHIERYSAVEFHNLIAYWESTHRFPVPSSLIRSDPYLVTFVVKRKNRRSHAGAWWKQILNLFLIAMREGWCDLDQLLDPYFLHFPKRKDEVASYPGIEARSANIADPQLNRREPADLIEALAECDAADLITDSTMRAIPLVGSHVSLANSSTWRP